MVHWTNGQKKKAIHRPQPGRDCWLWTTNHGKRKMKKDIPSINKVLPGHSREHVSSIHKEMGLMIQKCWDILEKKIRRVQVYTLQDDSRTCIAWKEGECIRIVHKIPFSRYLNVKWVQEGILKRMVRAMIWKMFRVKLTDRENTSELMDRVGQKETTEKWWREVDWNAWFICREQMWKEHMGWSSKSWSKREKMAKDKYMEKIWWRKKADWSQWGEYSKQVVMIWRRWWWW